MSNPVADAVEKVGGLLHASAFLGISQNAVRDTLVRGRMPNVTEEQVVRAERLARETGIPLQALYLGEYTEAAPKRRPQRRAS